MIQFAVLFVLFIVLLERLVIFRMDQILLGTNPYFGKNYFLFGENEDELREFLTDYILSYFSEQKYMQIEAGGDLFTFTSLDFKRNIGASPLADPRARIQDALSLFELFRSNESTSTL